MKSKLVLAALLFALAFIPSHLLADACNPVGGGNYVCPDGEMLRGDGAGNAYGNDGTFYPGGGNGPIFRNDSTRKAKRGQPPGARRAAREAARNQQCQRDCEAAYNSCLGQTSYCYDRCQARCLDEGRRCLNRCN